MEEDLLLSASHDLEVVNFDLKLTDDFTRAAQRVKQALLLFKGEWFLDIDLGMPYYEEILGQKNSIDAVRSIFVNEIRKVRGVTDLTEFNIDLNAANGTLELNFTIIDNLNNEVQVTL